MDKALFGVPQFQDRVRHKTSSVPTSGVVIAVYMGEKITTPPDCPVVSHPVKLLDVRTDDGQIIYKTLAKNWETIQTEEQSFE